MTIFIGPLLLHPLSSITWSSQLWQIFVNSKNSNRASRFTDLVSKSMLSNSVYSILGILLVSFKSWVWFPLGHRILTCNTFLFAILLEIQIIMVSKLPRCSDKFLVSNILSRTFRFSSTNLLRKKVLFISYPLSFDQAREVQ